MEFYYLVLCCVLFTTVVSFDTLDAISHENGALEAQNCKCNNGRCVTDNQGNTKCACKPGYALREDFNCQPCDCGSLGKCIYVLKLTGAKASGQVEYQKKCVCDQGSAEKDGVCVKCDCGENSACDFDYGERRCYCIEGFSEKNGVCTRCDCGFYGKCEYRDGNKKCQCDDGYLEHNGICTECDCGAYGTCSFYKNWKHCNCKPGYSAKEGKCEPCNCGPNSERCNYHNGNKHCKCKSGYADRYGTCEDCNCGANSKFCYFKNNQKTCSCQEGYVQKGETCQLGCSAKNPCQNGGYCKDGFCFCQKGTRGEFCEVIDECVNKLCPVQEGINCAYDVTSQKAYCRCLDSNLLYDPDLKQCRRTCEQDNGCKNGGKCGGKGSDKFCECPPGTRGDKCEIIDDCASGRVKCNGNWAFCSYDVKRGKAVCKCSSRGMEYDSLSGKCRQSCYNNNGLCRNGGLCMTRGDNTFCHCKKGTSGDLCDIVDDCARGVCGYSAGVRCVYDMKREGGVCQCTNPDHLYDEQTKTCKACDCGGNSLNCKLVNGKKVCTCRDGFADKNGICRKIRCVEKSCHNGRCDVTANEQEVCSCYEGYELVGDNCRRLPCTKTPCTNGTCIVRRNGKEECVCPAGHSLYWGVCMRGNCSMHTCFGGQCRNIEGERVCVCPAGYSLQGIGCFATVCKHQPCYGGVCHVEKDLVTEVCTCPDYHYLQGTVCKRILCQKPCFGGTCKKVNGREVCECPSGYVLFEGVCRANVQ